MKAPKYILNKPHLENHIEEEYRSHLKRMVDITNVKFSLKGKLDEKNRLNDLRKQMHYVNSSRKDSEQCKEQER